MGDDKDYEEFPAGTGLFLFKFATSREAQIIVVVVVVVEYIIL